MAKKLIIILFLSLLLLGCDLKEESISEIIVEENIESYDIVEEYQNEIIEQEIKADIIITRDNITPSQITLESGIRHKLVVYNDDTLEKRIEIPIYGAQIFEDLGPKEYRDIEIFSNNKGMFSIRINGAQLGTLNIN